MRISSSAEGTFLRDRVQPGLRIDAAEHRTGSQAPQACPAMGTLLAAHEQPVTPADIVCAKSSPLSCAATTRYVCEVGTPCCSSARWDLCGRRWETDVPVATDRI